ncbi:MAG: tRNA pseudouridine(38-40) synthase TruA [Christensenellales bacterium]
MRVALLIEYDGSGYAGWQRQENALTVQEAIEQAIFKATGRQTVITGAGRTDAGVSALGQVAHFDTGASIPADKYSYALNTILPPDIRIRQSREAAADFHARFDAVEKAYRYVFYNDCHHSALFRNLCCHVPQKLNIEAMEKAASQLAGEKDFRCFMAAGSVVKDTVRHITNIRLHQEGHYIFFEVAANGFLYHMVRIMAGTLLEIGLGKRTVRSMEEALLSCDRKQAGVTAPPQGLTMLWVRYENSPFAMQSGGDFGSDPMIR